jgi:glucosamine kinase
MDPEPSSPRWTSTITQGALYLGVGGGSRCRARIEDEFGTVVSEGGSGPTTTRLGIDEAWRSIMRA